MPRGGKRRGAGRPKGTGKFGEPTKAVRLPISRIKQIMQFIERNNDVYAIYPSGEAVDKSEQCSLIDELLTDSATTFMVRVSDDSMKGANILAHDLLIVDKSREPKHGDLVVAVQNGTLTVRRLAIKSGLTVKSRKMELKPENAKYKTVTLTPDDEVELWGVVKNVIHPV